MNDNINEIEPSKKKFNNKKNKVSLLILLALILIGTGTTYALWQLTFSQSGTNVITTGCLKLTLTEDTDAINITDATPTTDSEGKKLDPYTFTLENVCTTETSYVVNLETLSSGDKILADNYVKANLVSGENELFLNNLKETHINEEKVIEEATTAYKLHQGKLGNKEKISFSLRLWMDEATPASDAVMDATWQGKITVTITYVPPVSMRNVMKAMDIVSQENPSSPANGYDANILYTNNEKYVGMISKVVFQSQMNPYQDAVEVVDFSEAQDRSVLGYYVKNPSDDSSYDKYTLYIQANGKIKVNKNASYYGMVQSGTYRSINWNMEGFENLDTSEVTNMSRMFTFREYYDLFNLDLSSFDTSKVTNMSYMFFNSQNLASLNLSSFDTSKVTDMSYMFCWCSNVRTTINITNQNIEKYSNMFDGAATEEGAQITVNYTEETSDLVDRMIATKSENSNVVKGVLIQ